MRPATRPASARSRLLAHGRAGAGQVAAGPARVRRQGDGRRARRRASRRLSSAVKRRLASLDVP